MKAIMMQATCACGENFEELDAAGFSTTLCCPRCCCVLCINHPDFRVTIPLQEFCLKRGKGEHQRPLDELSMAEALAKSLVLDEWPTPAAVVDFGIRSTDHLSALQHAICSGVTAYDLDRVRGDGPAITKLLGSVPDQPHRELSFTTLYDELEWDYGDASYADRWTDPNFDDFE